MSLLKKKYQPLIGLDISSVATKLVELSRSGDHYRLEHFAIHALPPSAMAENAISDVDQVVESIRAAYKQARTKTHDVAVAVSSSHVITKTITMPSGLKDDELAYQIEVEAEHYIPYPLDEVNMDYVVLGPSLDNPNQDDIVLTACRKEIVDDYVAVIEAAGLSPVVIDVDANAVARAYVESSKSRARQTQDRTVAIIDFGATTTHINVLHNNHSVYTRDHSFGGKRLTEEIQRRYGLSYDEAGLAKKVGGLPENYQSEILLPFVDAMSQEAARGLQFFYSASPYNSIDEVLVAGGCAMIQGIDKVIADRIGVTTEIFNPFSAMSLAKRVNPERINKDSTTMVVACGLAMRRQKK